MQGCLEEVDMERYMNEQINAHLNFAAMQKAMEKGEFCAWRGCVYEKFQDFRIEICMWFSLVLI